MLMTILRMSSIAGSAGSRIAGRYDTGRSAPSIVSDQSNALSSRPAAGQDVAGCFRFSTSTVARLKYADFQRKDGAAFGSTKIEARGHS